MDLRLSKKGTQIFFLYLLFTYHLRTNTNTFYYKIRAQIAAGGKI